MTWWYQVQVGPYVKLIPTHFDKEVAKLFAVQEVRNDLNDLTAQFSPVEIIGEQTLSNL